MPSAAAAGWISLSALLILLSGPSPRRLRGFSGCEAREKGGRLTSDPNRSSLGLLPSGPDPVGEWFVHCQPPASYIGRTKGESKRGGQRETCHLAMGRGHP